MRQMEEKLQAFEQEILKEANQKKTAIEQDIAREKQTRIAQKENEILTKAYQTIQKELGTIRREQNERLSKAASDSKRLVLNRRGEIIQNVFQQLVQRVEDYRETEAYTAFLLRCAKAGLEEVGSGDIVVLIDKRDLKQKTLLEKLGVSVEQDAMDILGGCRVLNRSRNVVSDRSLAKCIAEEKEHFLEEADFRIQPV